MNSVFNRKLDAAPVQPMSADRGNNALGTRLSELARSVRQGYTQMFGIPDYERYTAHMASHHPCDPLLPRREFFIRSIERKYCRSGPRCC
jgi:uncharacterized short protein YbdD (DUF466 family)